MKCMAVLDLTKLADNGRRRAIAVDEEDDVEVGQLIGVDGEASFARVTAIRQHGQRESWSVLELSHPAPSQVRGMQLTAGGRTA